MGNGFLVAQLTATVSLIGGHWTGEVDETTGADVPEALSDNGVGETRVAGLVVVAEKSLIGGRVDTAPADRDYRGGCDSQSVVHPGGGCRDATKIDKARLATLTNRGRVARAS